MFKLVGVGGKIRGEEFVLENGTQVLGRDSSCDIILDEQGISKQHVQFTTNQDAVYLEDLDSSNGTFVNEKLTQKRTLENGDKIAFPNNILQFVHVKEKKIIIKKMVESTEEGGDQADGYLLDNENPDNILAKLIHFFKFRIMKFIHGFNEEFEWRAMVGIMLGIFICLSVVLTISPVLQSSKKLLIKEIAKRGVHYVEVISRLNARALESRNLDRVDSNFLKREDGVVSYELFDLNGNIFAPPERLNQQVRDAFSLDSREQLLKFQKEGKGKSLVKKFLYDQDETQIGFAKLITAFSPRTGVIEPVGIIAIRFQPDSLRKEAAENTEAYLKSLVMSAIVAILFFGVIYYLTIRPLDELRFQVEDVLRGQKKEVSGKLLMQELTPLKSTINSLLQRIKELSSDDQTSEFEEMEDDSIYVERLGEYLDGSNGPVMILDSQKLIQRLNPEAEDLIGIRESASTGESLLDCAREKGFAATIMELCDDCANQEGRCQKGNYEITGHEYEIFVNTMIGKDGFAKAFFVTFVKEE